MAGLEGMRLGNCQIVRRIGGGGMGDIYLAEQPGLGRQVAVKVVRGEGSVSGPDAFNEQATQQFLQEARAIAALEHPNILPLYDYGEQDGIHYLVMPYVAQGSLADMIEGRSVSPADLRITLPAPPAITTEIVSQAAAALQYAHEKGVIHRDAKPQNLLVRRLSSGPFSGDISSEATVPSSMRFTDNVPAPLAGATTPPPEQLHVLLADFGLARFMSALVGRTGTAGTPLYNAPEQYAGYPVPATDQYALACVAYLLLTGRPVFEGSLIELHHRHLTDTPAGVTRYNPHLPPAADTVLLRALAKDPADRYPSIREFAAALRAAINPLGQTGQAPWPRPRPLGDVRLVAQTPPSPAPENDLNAAADTRPSLELPAIQIPATPQAQAARTPAMPATSQPAVTPANVPFAGQPMPASTPAGGASLPPVGQIGMPSPNSQRLSAPPPSRTPSAGSWRVHSDAHPTALPPVARQRGWVYDLLHGKLPVSRPIALLALAVVVILVASGSVALAVSLHHKQPANTSTITYTGAGGLTGISQTITRAGVVTLNTLSPLGGKTPRNAATFLARTDQTNTQTTSLSALPAITAPTIGPHTWDTQGIERFGHVNQTDVGVLAPMSISAQADNHFLIEVSDGVLQIVPIENRALLQNYALADLFTPVLHKGGQLGESRVFYDVGSQSWVIVSDELALASDGNVGHGYLDIAISQTPGQIVSWSIYQISIAQGTTCAWADNPQIGNDDTTYYLTGTLFACGAKPLFRGTALWTLPKDAFSQGSAVTISVWTGFKISSSSPIFTLTPAQEQPGASAGWLVGTLAGYLDGASTSRILKLWAVVHATHATQAKQLSIVATTLTLPHAYADPVGAAQPGTTSLLSTGDARITSAVYAMGHLYAAWATAVNWNGDAQTRTGVYWLDMMTTARINDSDATASSISATLAQSAIDGFAGGYVFNPSLAVDANGRLVVIANASSASLYPSLVIAERHASDAPNTLNQRQPFAFLVQGVKDFTVGRWGDYSSAYYSVTNNAFWLGGAYTSQSSAAWATSVWQMH